MSKLRLLSLFAGIGGFELGLERSGGFETVAQCEIDPFCNKVLAKHWPEVKRYGDIRELTADQLAADGIAVDAICGGFPCQDISNAGRQAGIKGERSGLWSEYARLIGELRPRVVFVENVSALLGRGLDRVLGDLAALGYDAWWDCIPASAVGAPHRRDRLWLVAYTAYVQRDGGDDYARICLEGKPVSKSRNGGGPQALADPSRQLPHRSGPSGRGWRAELANGCQDVADAYSARLAKRILLGRSEGRAGCTFSGQEPAVGCWWATEPDVGRVAHGVPDRAHRLKALGNAVVPQIPELLGRAWMEASA